MTLSPVTANGGTARAFSAADNASRCCRLLSYSLDVQAYYYRISESDADLALAAGGDTGYYPAWVAVFTVYRVPTWVYPDTPHPLIDYQVRIHTDGTQAWAFFAYNDTFTIPAASLASAKAGMTLGE